MNYELAKKLYDVGFQWAERNTFSSPLVETYPTLSELIEACGDKFSSLIVSTSRKTWNAYETKINSGKIGVGYSPEEAIAYLWLELNK